MQQHWEGKPSIFRSCTKKFLCLWEESNLQLLGPEPNVLSVELQRLNVPGTFLPLANYVPEPDALSIKLRVNYEDKYYIISDLPLTNEIILIVFVLD